MVAENGKLWVTVMQGYDPEKATSEQSETLAEYAERLESIAKRLCRGDWVNLETVKEDFREVLRLGSKAKQWDWSPGKLNAHRGKNPFSAR